MKTHRLSGKDAHPTKEAKTSYEIGRIIVNKGFAANPVKAKKMLESALDNWPQNTKVNFLITSGGFVERNGYSETPFKIESEIEFVKNLKDAAFGEFNQLLNGTVKKKLKKVANFFSTGIDFYLTDGNSVLKSVEFVLIIDLKTDEIKITGKSYPIPDQEKQLQKFHPLKSHFAELGGKKVMILGCHDLNVFNPRTLNNVKDWRKEIVEEMVNLATKFKPEIVLQHPHTADTPGTWRNTWYNMKKILPSVKEFAGSGNYYYGGDEPRGTIEDCLGYSASENVLNIVVSSRKPYKAKFAGNISLFKK